MKRLTLFLVLCVPLLGLLFGLSTLTNTAVSAQEPDNLFANFDVIVVRAYFSDPQMVADLATWTEPWEVREAAGYVVVEVTPAEYQWLLDAGFRVELDEQKTLELNQPLVNLPGQVTGIPGYACYRTVEETFATAESIVAQYPNLASWIDIGDSWEKTAGLGGYDMMLLKLTNSAVPGPKPAIFIMSSVHAREYAPAELNTRLAEYLVQNYGVDADVTWLLDYHEFHLLLQSNPDGRKQAETGLSWRKNTNTAYCSPTSSSRGADLNRNFAFQWGCCGGSSGSQCSETYRGPTPASEPEVQTIQNYVRGIFPDQREDPLTAAAPITATGVFLDVHSYSQLVLWPWGFTGTQAPNATALQTFGRKMAYFNNYEPDQAIGLYPTDGTTDDFAYGELGVAAYVFEVGTSFFQDCGSFENTIWPDNREAFLYAAKAARTPYLTPAGPEVINVALSATSVAPGDVVDLTATADDGRFNNQNGTEPTQNVVAASYYLNVPPWEAGATPVAMSAADGSFNNRVEAVEATLDTAGLPTGQHIVYVQAEDALGNLGAVSAAFLYVVDPAVAPHFTGRVFDANTNASLAAAVTTNSPFQTSSDPASGEFDLLLVPGAYDVMVDAADPAYAPAAISGVVVDDYQVAYQDFALCTYVDVWTDDVEAGNPGWTSTGLWAITTEAASSPTHSWTDSPGSSYGNNWNYVLTSPVIDLSGYEGVALEFAQICDTEAGYDFCIVEASTNGTTWQTVAQFDGPHSTWETVTAQMPMLNNQPQARFRFRLDTDTSVTDDGWHVDDIALRALPGACGETPQARFTTSAPHLFGATTVFTNTSLGPNVSYAWDFGDGSPVVTTTNPTHAYAAPGAYTAVLTATNSLGKSVIMRQVDVQVVPQAAFTMTTPVGTGLPVVFDNQSTGTSLSYTWDFGDGSPVSSVVSPTHVYTAVGTYTVTLTAENGVGVDSAAQVITVLLAPQAAFTVTTPLVVGQTAVFTNQSSGDNLSYAWDFGDGSPSSSVISPTHVYTSTGVYTVTLTVSSIVGSDAVSLQVTVADDPTLYPYAAYLPVAIRP